MKAVQVRRTSAGFSWRGGDVKRSRLNWELGYMMQPRLDTQLTTEAGELGWTCSVYSHDEQDKIIDTPVRSVRLTETNMFLVDPTFAAASQRFTAKFKGKLIPREKDERFRFGLTVHGRAKLYVDGKLVVDNWTRQKRGNSKSRVRRTSPYVMFWDYSSRLIWNPDHFFFPPLLSQLSLARERLKYMVKPTSGQESHTISKSNSEISVGPLKKMRMRPSLTFLACALAEQKSSKNNQSPKQWPSPRMLIWLLSSLA